MWLRSFEIDLGIRCPKLGYDTFFYGVKSIYIYIPEVTCIKPCQYSLLNFWKLEMIANDRVVVQVYVIEEYI